MKKISLIIMFLVSTSLVEGKDLTVNDDCMHEAWNFGTEFGYNEQSEWYYTDAYFNKMCNDDGSFKSDIYN